MSTSIIDLEARRAAREEKHAVEAAAKEAARQAAQEAKEAARQAEQEALEKARAEAREKLRRYIREVFLRKHDLSYVSATDCWWERYDGNKWLPLRERAVRMLDWKRMRGDDYFSLFTEVLAEDGRTFRNITATFDTVPPDTLNTLSADFCPAAEGEPHRIFDVLVDNLANGCPEAKAHIEKLVLAKWRNPANATLPALCFHDPNGGSGKSLFVSTVVRTAFGGLICDNLSMEDVTGRFNSHLLGRAVWFVNESVEDKVNDNALKRILGSPTLWVEPKGLPKYAVANTAWVIVSGNSPLGSVRVANSGVDRRYSVVRTGGSLADRVAAEFGLADAEAARAWIAAQGVRLLSDPLEVGRWLGALGERHGEVDGVPAFHGKDYAALVDGQRPFHEQVFEAVFRDPDFAYIRKPLLYTLYADLCRSLNGGYGLLKNRGFYAYLEVWAEREKVAVAERKAAKWQRRAFDDGPQLTSADVFCAPGGPAFHGTLKCNDARYGTCEGGRWIWNVQPG